MKKIPTIFERDWDGDRSRVINKPNPQAEWVFRGEGSAFRKLDGTCCTIKSGALMKRRELKNGAQPPDGFVLVDADEKTGKVVGWMPVGDGREDEWHREAWGRLPASTKDGETFELVGEKIQGGAESMLRPHRKHILVAHRSPLIQFRELPPPTDFYLLQEWLAPQNIEGVVWHHPDGRMAKIKKRDFGLKRESVS